MLQDYYDANIPEDDEYYEDYEDDYYEDEDENEEYDEENLIFLDDNGYDKNYNGIFRNIHNSDFQESEWPDRGEYLYYMVEDEIHCFDCMREFTAEITVLVDDDANEDEMRNAVKKGSAKGGV